MTHQEIIQITLASPNGFSATTILRWETLLIMMGGPCGSRSLLLCLFFHKSNLCWLLPCGTKFLWEFIFADWQFYVFCGNLFAIRTDWFFLLEINFYDFQKVPDKSMIVFLFLLRMCNEIINNYVWFFSNNTTACLPYVKPLTEFCLSFWDKL